jgi:signal transduction histidine kinase
MAEGIDNSSKMVTHLQNLVERDKASLAREIHDELGGYLIAASMDAAVLRARADLDDETRLKIERVIKMLTAAIDLTRRLTEELHPTLLDNVGLFAALRWQLKNTCSRIRIHCTEDFPASELRFNSAASIALFRIGQEALSVASAHAAVTTIDFRVEVNQDEIFMHVSGDGATISESEDSRGVVALAFIRHRIRALGGAVTLDRPAAGGVTVKIQAQLVDALAH